MRGGNRLPDRQGHDPAGFVSQVVPGDEPWKVPYQCPQRSGAPLIVWLDKLMRCFMRTLAGIRLSEII